MSATPPVEPVDPAAEAPEDPAWTEAKAELNALLDEGREALRQDARAWGAEVRRMLGLVAAAERAERAGVRQFLHLDIAGSWGVSQHTAGTMMADALRLQQALPLTLQLLEAGELPRRQAFTVLKRTAHCPVEIARQVEAAVLADPAARALTPSELGKRVDTAILKAESEQATPDAAEQRHANALAERRAFTRPELDGMGIAGAVLPAEKLVAWQAALDALERRERKADRDAGIDRTADQRRADIFAALPAMALAGLQLADTARKAAPEDQLDLGVAGGLAGQPWTFSPEQVYATVIVNAHVPVSTVLELSREPGRLDRYGPISAEHIRLLRPRAWRRIMVDGDTGRPIAVDDRTTPVEPDPAAAREQLQAMLTPAVITDADEPQHDPSARLARLIDLRDVHCGGPGCSSSRCDRDHHDPWPGGPTSADNLNLLSRRCHTAKHHGWTLVRHPDGSTTWHSPLDRHYDKPGPHSPPPQIDLYTEAPPLRDRPQPTVRWITGEDPPPSAPTPPPEPDAASDPDDDPPPF